MNFFEIKSSDLNLLSFYKFSSSSVHYSRSVYREFIAWYKVDSIRLHPHIINGWSQAKCTRGGGCGGGEGGEGVKGVKGLKGVKGVWGLT